MLFELQSGVREFDKIIEYSKYFRKNVYGVSSRPSPFPHRSCPHDPVASRRQVIEQRLQRHQNRKLQMNQIGKNGHGCSR